MIKSEIISETCDDNGLRHRVFRHGYEDWKLVRYYHRIDAPARIWSDGGEEWYKEGKLHRLDGPAVIDLIHGDEWWINDNCITDEATVWIVENALPPWREWEIAEKALFALRFR